MKQLTKEQAVSLFESGIWKTWSDKEIVRFQLFQSKLCMPFSRFHEAIGKVLKRSVYTHEFANQEALKAEFLGKKEAPTFDEIIEMIPKEKRIVLQLQEKPKNEN